MDRKLLKIMMKCNQVSTTEMIDFFQLSLERMVAFLVTFLEAEIKQYNTKNPHYNCYMYQVIERIEEIYTMMQANGRWTVPYYKRYQVLRNRLYDLSRRYKINPVKSQGLSVTEKIYMAVYLQSDYEKVKLLLKRALINCIDQDRVLYPLLQDYIDSMATDHYSLYKTIISYILEHPKISQTVLLKIIYYFKQKLSSNEIFYQYGDDVSAFIQKSQDRLLKQNNIASGVRITENTAIDPAKTFIFTIDPDCTHLREDAISIVQKQEHYYVTLYVTDPSDIVFQHPKLLRCGYHNWFQKKRTVFPESYQSDHFSLDCAKRRPVLAYELVFDQAFNVLGLNLREDQIVVDKNYSYQSFNRFMNQHQNMNSQFELLQKLYEISYHYHKQNQVKAYYHTLKQLHRLLQKDCGYNRTNGAGELIVREVKILVQHIMAEFCYQNKIPCIYRNNNVQNWGSYLALDRNQIVGDRYGENNGSFYSDTNYGHYGLNFDCYTHATTTVRNFFAFVNSVIIKDVLIHANYDRVSMYEEQIRSLMEQQEQKRTNQVEKTLRK